MSHTVISGITATHDPIHMVTKAIQLLSPVLQTLEKMHVSKAMYPDAKNKVMSALQQLRDDIHPKLQHFPDNQANQEEKKILQGLAWRVLLDSKGLSNSVMNLGKLKKAPLYLLQIDCKNLQDALH